MAVKMIGKDICFWCTEAFHGCHLHDNSHNVFWNDVSVGSFFNDEFQIVEEKELINVQTNVQYSNGKFFLPPTASTTPTSANFYFEKCEKSEKEEATPQPISISPPKQMPKLVKRKYTKREKKSEKPVKAEKPPKKEKEPKRANLRSYYTKVHKNAIKTISQPYTRGKKCDQSQKLFVCDICEISFTLRHNMQTHLVGFHGETANVSEDKVAILKDICNRKDGIGRKRKSN